MGADLIEVDDLCFGYDSENPILKDISFKVSKPGFICVVGPNGVGKSTLVKCICGHLKPSSGIVKICGKDVREYSLRSLSKIVGFVPVITSDFSSLTVLDTVLLGRYTHQKWRTTPEDLEIAYKALEAMKIEGLAMRSFKELSAGQHQKVMLAKGLAQQPRVLLLDEPTANLDIKHQIKITRMMKDICHNDGITVVMICHDLNIAAKYSDRILMMSEGTIWADGTPEEVITESNLKKVYDVNSKVVFDEARPHIIVRDEEDSSSEKELLA